MGHLHLEVVLPFEDIMQFGAKMASSIQHSSGYLHFSTDTQNLQIAFAAIRGKEQKQERSTNAKYDLELQYGETLRRTRRDTYDLDVPR